MDPSDGDTDEPTRAVPFSKDAAPISPSLLMGNRDLSGLTLSGGKYLLERRLGAGGAGSVYLSLDQDIKERVAIKILKELDEKKLERFRREAKATRKLEHPNVLRVFDFGCENGVAYIVMEYLDGEPLSKILKRESPLQMERSLALIKQACRALSHAHDRKILHRDVKPGNMVIMKSSDGTELLKIVDFGISKILDDQSDDMNQPNLTTTGHVFGSPAYMSPEQTRGAQVDNRSDIYSLGCVLYECLTGTPPHMGDSAIKTLMMHQTQAPLSLREASMGQEFPSDVEKLVQRMLAKEPDLRYTKIEQVLEDIDKLDMSRFSPGRGSSPQTIDRAQPKSAPEPQTITPRAMAGKDKILLMVVLALIVIVGAIFVSLAWSAMNPGAD